MKPTERTVIYSALGVLAALNSVFLLSNSGRAAFAETGAFIADVLGPADAVKLTDGDKELEVKAKDGRLSWGSGDFKQTYSVAFVDISKALNPLMEKSTLAEERSALETELEAKDKEFKERIESFRGDIEGKDRNDANVQEAMRQAQAVYEEYVAWGREAISRRNAMDVEHLQKAYRELTSAVDVVSQKLGADIVLRFIPTENEFQGGDAESALTEIRLRSALKYPGGLDITAEVLEELSIAGG